MDLKKFLSPTKAVLALAAALFLLFVPCLNYDNGIRCIRAPCPSTDGGSVAAWAFKSAYWSFSQWEATQHRILEFHGLPTIYSLNFPIATIGIVLCYAAGSALAPMLAKKQNKAKKD